MTQSCPFAKGSRDNSTTTQPRGVRGPVAALSACSGFSLCDSYRNQNTPHFWLNHAAVRQRCASESWLEMTESSRSEAFRELGRSGGKASAEARRSGILRRKRHRARVLSLADLDSTMQQSAYPPTICGSRSGSLRPTC
jgi:hypothetical protein